MAQIELWITAFRDALWSPYFLVILLVGTGLLMTIRLRFIQARKLGHSFNLTRGIYDHPDDPGEVTHFQALSAALSSTVGTGNIAGVATAIAAGGPGAIFWMWITGLFGMATKMGECTLAIKYREITPDGVVRGGPMYYILKGLGESKNQLVASLASPFAYFFAFCMALAPMIAGNMAQANSAADALEANFGIPPLGTGIVLASLIGIVLLGGIKRIGGVAGRLIPFMAVVYAIGVLTLLFMYIDVLPSVIQLIFTSAFNPQAAIGGFAGASVSDAISFGASRGVFSNEAGLGSAPIAHAAAKTSEPVREGLVAMMEPLIDTLCINTMTAFAILVTGAWTTGETGAELTSIAFGRGLPGVGGIVVAIAITMFAFSTALTQGYYGNRAVDFLWGEKAASIYRWIFVGMHVVGAVITLELVWTLADVANGLLALPNLLTLIIMSGSIALWVKDYFSRPQIPYAELKKQEKSAGSNG